LRAIGLGREENIKPKVTSTIKEIELHRMELDNLRAKLVQRKKVLYETATRAIAGKERTKASVYATEWEELSKVVKVVDASELALIQVTLRLQSILEVGDVMKHMSLAFKVLRKINKSVQGLGPALDQASSEINSTLTETMAEMGNVSPSIALNIRTESGEELVEQARRLAEQRGEEMRQKLRISPKAIREYADGIDRVPELATGDDEEEAAMLGVLYGAPASTVDGEAEGELLHYAKIHDGIIDITDASTALDLPSDEVEQAMLKLMSQGKIKVAPQGVSQS
jgi:division protein CdvB (Snf7/Vps24/ESCRT-III family)